MVIAIAALLLGFILARSADSAPLADIDPRLAPLGITIEPAADCSRGCWRLVSARFEDPEESAGLHHIWTRVLDNHGNQLVGQEWQVKWPGGRAGMVSKAAPEWSDFPMFGPGGCYNPANGPGPYSAFVVQNNTLDATRSDIVRGLGLPQCQHVSYRLVWQWQPALNLVPRLWLPVARQ